MLNTELIKSFQTSQKKYKKGQIIENEGTLSKYLYFIESGACKQYLVNNVGDQIVFRLIVEGDFCAAAYSLITGKKSISFIECCQDSVISIYDYQAISVEYDKSLALANLSRQISENYFIEEQERAIALRKLSPRERYEKLCNEKPEHLQVFNLGDIASYLGMRRETLSRVRRERF